MSDIHYTHAHLNLTQTPPFKPNTTPTPQHHTGLGCGANPDVGKVAGEESKAELLERIGDAHMVFITAGMGGGTGTGAAPVIARTCLEAGILTVAVVTRPFRFEGTHRMRLAEEGLRRLQDSVDTLLVIPNQNLFKMVRACVRAACLKGGTGAGRACGRASMPS